VVVNGAVIVMRCIRRNTAHISLVAQLVEWCIQIKEIGAFGGIVGGFVCSRVAIVVDLQCCSVMADQLAVVGVLYDDFYGTVSTEVIVVKQE